MQQLWSAYNEQYQQLQTARTEIKVCRKEWMWHPIVCPYARMAYAYGYAPSREDHCSTAKQTDSMPAPVC